MTYTAAQHHEMEGTAPFELPEEAMVGGRKRAGTLARIYWLLRLTAERAERHRIGEQLGPAGWVPNYYLRRAWSGGNAGDRRLRDLRELGVRIDTMRFAADSAVVLFRWAGDPEPNRLPLGSQETCSKARNGDTNRFPADAAGSVASSRSGSAQRLRFWICVGFPGDDAPGRVNLIGPASAHPLGFANDLLAAVVTGKVPSSEAFAIYDRTLRSRWPLLRAWIDQRGEHVLWLAPEAAETINPLPLVVEILTKCGAAYQGDWNAREETR